MQCRLILFKYNSFFFSKFTNFTYIYNIIEFRGNNIIMTRLLYFINIIEKKLNVTTQRKNYNNNNSNNV